MINFFDFNPESILFFWISITSFFNLYFNDAACGWRAQIIQALIPRIKKLQQLPWAGVQSHYKLISCELLFPKWFTSSFICGTRQSLYLNLNTNLEPLLLFWSGLNFDDWDLVPSTSVSTPSNYSHLHKIFSTRVCLNFFESTWEFFMSQNSSFKTWQLNSPRQSPISLITVSSHGKPSALG